MEGGGVTGPRCSPRRIGWVWHRGIRGVIAKRRGPEGVGGRVCVKLPSPLCVPFGSRSDSPDRSLHSLHWVWNLRRPVFLLQVHLLLLIFFFISSFLAPGPPPVLDFNPPRGFIVDTVLQLENLNLLVAFFMINKLLSD
jgi:hypothetical protein